MGVNQTDITQYNIHNSNRLAQISTVALSITAGDCIAYYDTKTKMYVFMKIASKNIDNNVVSLTGYGVRFKINDTVNIGVSLDNTIIGIPGSTTVTVCKNGKPGILASLPSDEAPMSANIAYVEFFGRETFTVSDLFQNETAISNDDINQLTVLPGGAANSASGTLSGTDCITHVSGTPSNLDEFLMCGISRQLAYNFKNSI